MQDLAERLLRTIRKQQSVRPGDRLAVAVSGGADSVALLLLLLELRSELGIVLSIAHVNHKLRGEESDKDALFVAELAQNYAIEIHACDAPVDADSSGIEAAARALRYDFFRRICREGRATKIATAHTLDDQAETVLLRLFRGTGIRGLAGIHPRIIFTGVDDQAQPYGEVVRPLLGVRHSTLLQFLHRKNQTWREDSSNQDVAFTRNRVRHRLLPLIGQVFGQEFGETSGETFGKTLGKMPSDAAIAHLGELAEIARAEEEHWTDGHPEIADVGGAEKGQAASLSASRLLGLPLAAQRRLVRGWIERNAPDGSARISFRLIEDLVELARGPAGKTLELSKTCAIRRGQHELSLQVKQSRRPGEIESTSGAYEYVLTVPGAIEILELGANIEAQIIDVSAVPEDCRGQLLDLTRIPKHLTIRNWRAGDRFWPAHTASAKKVKELLSDRHATGTTKKLWPVAVMEGKNMEDKSEHEHNRIVWLRDFAVPARLRAPSGAKAIWIRQIASQIVSMM